MHKRRDKRRHRIAYQRGIGDDTKILVLLIKRCECWVVWLRLTISSHRISEVWMVNFHGLQERNPCKSWRWRPPAFVVFTLPRYEGWVQIFLGNMEIIKSCCWIITDVEIVLSILPSNVHSGDRQRVDWRWGISHHRTPAEIVMKPGLRIAIESFLTFRLNVNRG